MVQGSLFAVHRGVNKHNTQRRVSGHRDGAICKREKLSYCLYALHGLVDRHMCPRHKAERRSTAQHRKGPV